MDVRPVKVLTPTRGAIVGLAIAVVLSACSATPQPGTSESPRVVDLTMTEEGTFEPATIQVRRGEAIRFVVRNVSDEGHEAYIGTEEEQRIHATDHSGFVTDQAADVPHTGYGVHVAPFGDGELTFTFDSGGEWVIGCHYPGHYEAGMRAVVEVSE